MLPVISTLTEEAKINPNLSKLSLMSTKHKHFTAALSLMCTEPITCEMRDVSLNTGVILHTTGNCVFVINKCHNNI